MTYNTKQRDVLIEFFNNNQDKIFSVEDIVAGLESSQISVSAVYRNLNALVQQGKVRKTTKNSGTKAYYQYLDCDTCKGHIHLACKQCGRTTHLDDEETKLLVNNVLNVADFSIDKNDTILYGVCKKCCKK